MGVEESIGNLKEDIKEIKDTMKKIDSALSDYNVRFVSTEKDLATMVNEYMRLNSEYRCKIEELKEFAKDQNDYIWTEIRTTKKQTEDMIDEKIKNAIRDLKLVFSIGALFGIGGFVYSVLNKYIDKVIK